MKNTQLLQGNAKVIAIIVILVAIGAGYYFMTQNANAPSETKSPAPTQTVTPTATESPTTSPTKSPTESPTTSPTATGNTGVNLKVFTVVGSPFKFSLNEIKVKKGDRVRIVFNNTLGTHDWVIDEFNVRTSIIEAGQTSVVEFTPDKVGTFEYYCSIGTHRLQGMKGNLIVE